VVSEDITMETKTPNNGGGDPKVRWKNRRKMAWTSLIYMIIKTLLLLFVVDPERMKILSEPIIWSYFCSTAIVGTYMGAATFEHIKMK
jgi:hypothetical protein